MSVDSGLVSAGGSTPEDDRLDARREVGEFSAIAFGMTGLLHGGLAASRRPLSLDASVPALVYGVGLAGPTLAALAGERDFERSPLDA